MTQEQERDWNWMVRDARYYAENQSATVRAPYDSEKAVLAVDAELTRLRDEIMLQNEERLRLRAEVERLSKQLEVCLGWEEHLISERNGIAEAVREKYPDFIITEALAIGIERGEFAQKGEGQ